MDAEIFLSVIAGSAALTGLFGSIISMAQKRRAEREFLNVLAQETVATPLRELRYRIAKHGAMSVSELQSLTARLGSLAGGLSKEHKLQIQHGLRQRSLRGRARYAAKLMNGAGIGSGSLPIATP
jgi:hypothetical protein